VRRASYRVLITLRLASCVSISLSLSLSLSLSRILISRDSRNERELFSGKMNKITAPGRDSLCLLPCSRGRSGEIFNIRYPRTRVSFVACKATGDTLAPSQLDLRHHKSPSGASQIANRRREKGYRHNGRERALSRGGERERERERGTRVRGAKGDTNIKRQRWQWPLI